MVTGLLSYHDWHLHLTLTHQPLLAFLDEPEGQCHTHSSARVYMGSHKFEFARSCTGAHIKVDRCTYLHIQISLWCSVSRDSVFLFLTQQCQEVSEPTVNVLSWTPRLWNVDLYVSTKKWNHPFLCQLLCKCVCAFANGKSSEQTRGLGLTLNSVTLL